MSLRNVKILSPTGYPNDTKIFLDDEEQVGTIIDMKVYLNAEEKACINMTFIPKSIEVEGKFEVD